jgi:hypothetical protein
VGRLRAHLVAVSIVVAAVAVLGGVFAFARPQSHPYVMPPPPGDGLPYATPTYTRTDAVRAFTGHGIRLVRGAQSPGIKGFHTADDKILVDVFGDKKVDDAAGFSDYYTFVDGHYALSPKNCVAGAKSAERWRGNVRLIVYCDAPGNLPRAVRALDSLSRG